MARASRMISTLSMPMRGRSTGIPTTSSSGPGSRASGTPPAPGSRPVTRASAPARRAIASAMRTISRRYTTTRSGGGTPSTTSRWISPKGTRNSRAWYWWRASRSTSARAFRCEVSGRYGTLWKCTNSTSQPRFRRRHAATGESIPPESSAATVPPRRPAARPGRRRGRRRRRPPGAAPRRARSGPDPSRFTRVGKRWSTWAPSSRLISTDVIGKTLNARRAVIRNDSKLRPSSSWSTAARTARPPRRDDSASAKFAIPNTVATRSCHAGEIGGRLEVQHQAAGQLSNAPHAASGRRPRRGSVASWRRNSGRLPPFRLISW